MKIKTILSSSCLLITITAHGFFTEDFSDSSTMVLSTPFFSDGSEDYFGLSDGSSSGDFGLDPVTNFPSKDHGSYTGYTGLFLIGEDLDGEGATLPITVTWDDINISGQNNLVFSGLFGASTNGIDNTNDAIIILYDIDNSGTFTELIVFEKVGQGQTGFNGGFKDPNSTTTLGNTLNTITASIAGTGSVLDLRLSVSLNGGNEHFAVDNFSIVPESNTYALLAGMFALASVMLRRRSVK